MSEPGDSVSELRRIASADLHDETVRLAPRRWRAVLPAIKVHRLTGIAVAAYEAGRLDLRPAEVDDLIGCHRAVMVNTLRIEQRLLHLYDEFTSTGIRIVVLKGPAIAHTVYADPGMRPFGDLDLLVSTKDWEGACRILVANGFTRDLPEPRPGFDVRFGKAATHSDASGLQVDLHRTLVVGPFGLWLDPEELMENADTLFLGGRAIARLDATGLLLNAALHAGLGSSAPLLLPLRDVVQTARDPAVDWDGLASWATRWRLSAPLRLAFTSAAEVFGVVLPAGAEEISSAPSRRSERRVMRAYSDRRRRGGVAMATMAAIPGIRAKAAYAFGLSIPDREFLRARTSEGASASYMSRWRVPVRWLTQRRRWNPRNGELTTTRPREAESDR